MVNCRFSFHDVLRPKIIKQCHQKNTGTRDANQAVIGNLHSKNANFMYTDA